MIIGLADMALVTVLAVAWFKVLSAGSVGLLFLAGLLYLLATLGLGLLISSAAGTQQEAFMVGFLAYMPAILLSGFMFPVSSMPKTFQWLTLLNPVRHFLEIDRGIFQEGVGLPALWPRFLALAAMDVALLRYAARRFQRATS